MNRSLNSVPITQTERMKYKKANGLTGTQYNFLHLVANILSQSGF